MQKFLGKLFNPKILTPILVLVIILGIGMALAAYSFYGQSSFLGTQFQKAQSDLEGKIQELEDFQSSDQVQVNKKLAEEIENINQTYKKSSEVYENIEELKAKGQKTDDLSTQYAKIVALLSQRNYASASSELAALEKTITDSNSKLATNFKVPTSLPKVDLTDNKSPTDNSLPGNGYKRQQVAVEGGTFMVDIIAADLSSTRVVVDTASNSDCSNDCPVLPLAEYISRNGAFAGINGSYFCPSTYPSCAGKTNSFDTLLMNKNKTYFNSSNNVYSTVPAVIFLSGSVRFVNQSQEWGRDTGIDSMIANYPLLTFNGQNNFGGSGDVKHTGKGPRGFVGASGSTVYIGIVYNATVSEAANVLHKLGVNSSLNLDSGGSTALWSGGYKAGPGRSIPNAILFVRK